MSGVVVKNIADRISAIDTVSTNYDLQVDSTYIDRKKPLVKSGKFEAIQNVMTNLQQPFAGQGTSWVKSVSDGKLTAVTNLPLVAGTIPDLTGMGAKDAIFLCEKSGLRIHMTGIGKVISQSLPAGSKTMKGQEITLIFEN